MGDVPGWSGTDASNTDLFPEGMAFSGVNDGGRAIQGAIARWFKDTNGSVDASGSANVFAITSNRTIAAYADDLVMAFTANHTITGAATLNLNGIGAKDIKRFNGNALASGDIVSGQPVVVVYKLAADDWFMVSAAAALTGNMFADFDENASPGDPAADDARLYAQDESAVTNLLWRDSAGVASGLRNATQAEMETGTSVLRTVTPGRQHFHPGHPKAGGNLDGNAAPAAFLSGDYGMGAVTDGGTGNYTLAFDTAFADTNYWCTAWGRSATSDDDGIYVTAPNTATKTESSFQITTDVTTDATHRDAAEVGITFWGDYA